MVDYSMLDPDLVIIYLSVFVSGPFNLFGTYLDDLLRSSTFLYVSSKVQ